MKFNIDDYTGKYVMHCKTEKEAKDFCKYLHNDDRRWSNGDSYLSDTNYNMYQSDTAYAFNEGKYSDVDWYKRNNYTILEWSDFMYQNFTKADLKTGDVIMRRDGTTEIVNRELEMFITKNGWNDFNDIKDDLTSRVPFNPKRDIVAVRRPQMKGDCQFYAFDHNCGALVYERKEPEEMTLAEVCRLLGKEIKIVK